MIPLPWSKGSFTLLLAFLASFGIPVLGNWLAFSYAFSAEAYATTSTVFALCAVATVCGSLGLEYHLLRLGEIKGGSSAHVVQELMRCLRSAIPATVFVAVVLCIGLATGFAGPGISIASAVAVGGFLVFGVASKLSSAALRASGRSTAAVFVDRIVRETGLLLAAVICLFQTISNAVEVTFICAALLAAVAFVWSMVPLTNWRRAGMAWNAKGVPAPSSGELTYYTLAETLFLRADIIFLSLFLGATELATFAFYSYLSGVLGVGFLVLNFANFPKYASLHNSGGMGELRALVRSVAGWSTLVAAATYLGLTGLEHLHVGWVGGDSERHTMEPAFIILCASQLLMTFFGPVVPALVVAKKGVVAANWYVFGTLLRGALLPVGYALAGIEGVALASLLAAATTKGAQSLALKSVLSVQQPTTEPQRWPNLYIVGAPKCGTTALFHYLARSPHIFVPADKEPHYFCDDFPGLRQVKSEVDYTRLFDSWADQPFACDASVWYLLSSTAATRIWERRPDAKIVIMLRNPVDMVLSFFEQATITFAEDQETAEDAWRLIERRRTGDDRPAYCPEPALLDYRAIADFEVQVRRYYERFGRDKVHVIVLEELIASPEMSLKSLSSFLGIDLPPAQEFARVNERKMFWSPTLRRVLTQKRFGFIYLARALRPLIRALGIRPSTLIVPFAVRVSTSEPPSHHFLEDLHRVFEEPIRRLETTLNRRVPFGGA